MRRERETGNKGREEEKEREREREKEEREKTALSAGKDSLRLKSDNEIKLIFVCESGRLTMIGKFVAFGCQSGKKRGFSHKG